MNVVENEMNQESCVLYPNPTKDEIQIRLYLDEKIEGIKVLSLNGEQLQLISSINENQKVDVSTLPQGAYILQIQTTLGIIHKRFVKM